MARRDERGFATFSKWQWAIANFLEVGPEEFFVLRGWPDWRGKLWCALHFGHRHDYDTNPWYHPGPRCCINCGKRELNG